MANKSISKNSDNEILETAKARFQFGLDADSENRECALQDMDFRAGNQWPDEIKNVRGLEGRPCLTINKIPQNIHQITNDQRQNRPAIKVSPADDNADPDTAKVFQGITRNIENISNADTAYDIAFDSAVTGGRGFFRVVTDYCDPSSFDQEIKIKSIQNPHSVILDPGYKEPDGSDAGWGFCFEDISKDDFEALYPKAKANEETFNWGGDSDGFWFSEETVRVSEYFERVLREDKLYLAPDGSTVLKSDVDKLSDEDIEELEEKLGVDFDDIEELKSRDTAVPEVHWYKIVGNEILERTIWPGSWIPIFPVHGEELFVRGKRVFEGIVRHARDPQRMYNYWASCETETIALAPKAPFIGAEGQFEGHEEKWETAHLKNYPYLEYKPTTLANGQPAPPPQRNFGGANVQAVTQARMLASDDLKSTTGIYDASLGNRSNESSGVAINRRTQQAQTGNFHFVDNLSRSIRHLGRCLVEIIPKIYDTKRMIRIIGPDDKEEIVAINQIYKDRAGNPYQHDLSVGKYDVNISTGPNYASKRQEAVESMLSISNSVPGVAAATSDLLVKNMDWPGADEIAERLKRTIPPEILGEQKEEQGLPPEVQAQMEQMNQVIEKMSAELEESQRENNSKQFEIESKEKIEFAKIERDLRIKQAELEAKSGASPEQLDVISRAIFNLRTELDDRLPPLPQMHQHENQFENTEVPEMALDNLTGEMSPGLTGEIPSEEEEIYE